jgi:uncharacterized protein involved in oxidation of intracellular sulfur
METITIIINDAPYGSEKPWNALRLAGAILAVSKETKINIFLMGDAVSAAKGGQTVPTGYYNLENMLSDLLAKNVKIKACGTCCKSRGLKQEDLINGVEVGKMIDLTNWTLESSKVINF